MRTINWVEHPPEKLDKLLALLANQMDLQKTFEIMSRQYERPNNQDKQGQQNRCQSYTRNNSQARNNDTRARTFLQKTQEQLKKQGQFLKQKQLTRKKQLTKQKTTVTFSTPRGKSQDGGNPPIETIHKILQEIAKTKEDQYTEKEPETRNTSEHQTN
jgi:hypothetical protein